MKLITRRKPHLNSGFSANAFKYFLLWGICTSLTITICTFIDTILIGNIVGSDGIAVINIATPVFLFYTLIGVTVGSGAAVSIGRCLGADEKKEANQNFHSLLMLGVILSALSLLPLLFKDAFFSFLGAEGMLKELTEQYLPPIMCLSPIFIFTNILSAAVRTDSDPRRDAIASAVVIILNLSLDVVFMKFMHLGIFGASIALCIAKTAGVAVLMTHFFKKHRMLSLGLKIPRLHDIFKFIRDGFGIGSASFFSAVTMLLFNTLLIRHGGANGTVYVAIFGVLYTINTLPAGIFEGTSNALSTVISFLIGESDIDGICDVRKRALLSAAAAGTTVALLCLIFPESIVRFFGIAKGSVMAADALRIFAISIAFTGINFTITAFYQATGRPKSAGVISVLRSFISVIALGTALIPVKAINGLAFTYVCTEFLCTAALLIISVILPHRRFLNKKYAVNGDFFENTYVIETESAAQISEDIESVCEEWEIGAKPSFFINFICEEVLLNIIKFALRNNDKKYYISIKLINKGDDVILRIRDNVSMYDPFEASGDEIDNGVLKIIKNKTKHCEYCRKMIFNYLYIIL